VTRKTASFAIVLFLLVGLLPGAAARSEEKLLTVAEKSDYRATSRHADVVAYCEQLVKLSPLIRLGQLGTSFEGRKLPLVILADPPVATAEEAARSGKLVVFAMGNIHAGEVDGKEALLMLARDLATTTKHPLLKDLILVFAPIFNADGNERMSKTNRPGQKGPEEGMGIRANAQGFDLNRDYVKLESPEVRALVRFFTHWNPALVIDMHTTNGSYHQYAITYEGPRNPAGDPKVIELVRDQLLPEVGRRLEKRSGYKSFFYGNFVQDRTAWETVPPIPRFGLHYLGLRNRLSILCESYSYASYKDRILASRDFVQTILEYVAEHQKQIHQVLADARSQVVAAGRMPRANDRVAVQQKEAALDGTLDFLGYVEETRSGRHVPTDQTRVYRLRYLGKNKSTRSVSRPYAYLFPASFHAAVENLQRHGINVDELREDIELDVDAYQVQEVHASSTFQKHRLDTLRTTARQESKRVPAGTILVRTGQPLGDLVVYLLEPESEDGLATWNFFDEGLAEGKEYPVLRLTTPVPITSGPVRPLAEDRTLNKAFTIDLGGRGLRRGPPRRGGFAGLGGSPVRIQDWLDDGEHFLQVKQGRLYKVEARTGRLQPFHDPDILARALAALPTIDAETARGLARGPNFHMNAQRSGALFTVGNDLYFCGFDAKKAARLTRTPGQKELATFSPDGRFVAFVRDQNLFVVDIATQTERALTTDGDSLIFNGKADWVYGEEVYDRSPQTFWWSPDSKQIAFMQIDDRPVYPFTVIDEIPRHQTLEKTPYPKAGEPNPRARLGVVSAAGGSIRWVDTSNYSDSSSLLVRAGWTPDSQKLYFYAQNRTQTWLDFCTVPAEGGTPQRLFRETTKAWVDIPSEPHFLKDGSFVLPLQRSGWNHIYHFAANGTLIRQVTSGPWELSTDLFAAAPIKLVDEERGWIYFTAKRDNPLADNLYRVRLDGSVLERLTPAAGSHQVSLSPRGNYFVDSWSDHTRPDQTRLAACDGSLARTLDTNPVYEREEYQFGRYEPVQIPTADGFALDGVVILPPNLDPKKHYPVWFMTYGGPHAPTVRDSWAGGHAHDQALARLGFIVFHCDPRSATSKGAVSTWTNYRQLGVQELKDIETAIRWLGEHYPCVDPKRIGMSGASYGGYMTCFAMTHSQIFAAGVAGAPVTDWHNYDTIYTERYMSTPDENPEGYDSTSVVKAAAKLHGKLLLVHGVMDDNVHMQNTLQFAQALQQSNKDFEIMFYPRSRHGGFGPHYERLMIEFMQRNLGAPR
jgi:dipeptidyl aminopeptidase/acylaminoacyl peptidase